MKCKILGMLCVHISKEVNDISIQIVDVIDLSISIVSQVMGIHIPPWCLGSSIRSPLWCKMGIIA